MSKKIIIINGIATSGKDEFVKIYKKHSDVPVMNWSSIDAVKEIAKIMGWNGIKDDKSRKFLSDIKDAWTEYNDGIFKHLCSEANKHDNCVIFIHCREPKAITQFKDHFKDECITLLIDRKGIPIPNNHADQNVHNYQYDYVILNWGTLEEFEEKIKLINFLDFYGSPI